MQPVKVFFCEETSQVVRNLRRYETGECSGPGRSYHNAHSETVELSEQPPRSYITVGADDARYAGDPRWPVKCDHCEHRFTDEASSQVWQERILRRTDTGEEFGSRSVPVGGVIECWWLADRPVYAGPDGRCLQVKLPDGHDWIIDSRANNCTMPDDDVHKCWVRHGRPEDGTLHVDKQGHTCAAGAGSIATGSFHGFLHHGHITSC
jgi:hypothetical protein